MLRLYVVNAADIFIPPRQLPQPGASLGFISRSWIEPDVSTGMVGSKWNKEDPFQDVVTALFFPKLYILILETGRISVSEV